MRSHIFPFKARSKYCLFSRSLITKIEFKKFPFRFSLFKNGFFNDDHMIVFSLFWFLIIAAVAVLPMVKLYKGQRTMWWDYAYPFSGVATWFPLGMSNIGSTVSLSNFVVEVFWIAVISVAVPWIRWLLSRFVGDKIKTWSFVLTFSPIVAAIAIRLTMPTLPE